MQDDNLDPLRKRIKFCREMARKQIKKLGKNLRPPIPVFEIARNHDFEIEEIELPDNISAKLYPELGTISVNSRNSKTRQRFSVAHELGHHLLGHPNEESYYSDRAQIRLYDSEADEFAGELLVPRDLLKKECEECNDLEELRKRFRVSKETLFIQIKKHGLLKKFI